MSAIVFIIALPLSACITSSQIMGEEKSVAKKSHFLVLADKAVELKFAESVSHMTVQRVLKKTNFNLIAANTGKSLRKEAQHS
jgi:hypothetical protein